ncbi:PEP-CTERM sorting domain-containing protein [Stieleria varia]|uniref:PEP-CTERM protein-sorting domain-containing protein n=1 Tax=Stieleria varia TaxID=2528005 RepID=A0A5C6AMZ5_9BACT|nr:PEP-CTERM sorting domain-containing protein [Stieleria varia]TWU00781.1 hypothetical protein Pla52n_41500 [Stieleria varia]
MSGHRVCSVVLVCLLFVHSQRVHGGIVHIALDGTQSGLVAGDSFTNNLNGLISDGVTFDLNISVTGSATLNGGSGGTGLAVAGGLTVGIDTNEWLQFTVSTSNVTGGTVVFNGFSGLDFSEYVDGADVVGASTTGINPADLITSVGNDPTFVTPLPNNVFVLGGTATSGSGTSFRIDDVFASFTGTAAVPEPSSFALILLSGMVLLRRRRV